MGRSILLIKFELWRESQYNLPGLLTYVIGAEIEFVNTLQVAKWFALRTGVGAQRFGCGNSSVLSGTFSCIGNVQGLNVHDNIGLCDWLKKNRTKTRFFASFRAQKTSFALSFFLWKWFG